MNVSASIRPNKQERWAIALFALVLVLVVFARIRLLAMPLERDEGEFAYVGQLMLDGVQPFTLAYVVKLPGTYLAYALFMTCFGQTATAIHFGFLLVNLATVGVLYLVGRRLLDLTGTMVACASYVLLSASPEVLGLAGHATQLINLAALGGLLALLRARESGRLATIWWSGVLFGLAFLFKQPALFLGMFGGALLLRDQWQIAPWQWRPLLMRAGLFIAGCAAPFALVCLWMWIVNCFPRFWYWNIDQAFFRSKAMPAEGVKQNLTIFFKKITYDKIFWLFALAGLACLAFQRDERHRRFLLFALTAFSLVAFVAGFYFLAHYFIVVLPVIAILTAVSVTAARGRWSFAPLGLCSLACLWAIFGHREIWFQANTTQACRLLYHKNPFPEAVALGDYIRQNSRPDARITVLGSEPEIYFYAHRHSSSGFVNMYDFTQPLPMARAMQMEFIREVETVGPEYLLLVNIAESWGWWASSDVTVLDWSRHYTAQNYVPVRAVYIFPDHTQTIAGTNYPAANSGTDSTITVLKRKSAKD